MRILGNVRPDRQMLLLSATFPKPVEQVCAVQRLPTPQKLMLTSQLARKALKRPVSVIICGRCAHLFLLLSLCTRDSSPAGVLSATPSTTWSRSCLPTQSFGACWAFWASGATRGRCLCLWTARRTRTSCLSRCESTATTPCLCTGAWTKQTERVQSGAALSRPSFAATSTCSRDFKSGVIDVLVCTSIAARGLDVPNLRLVVNFDCPNHYEDYVHRVGRTGRAGIRPPLHPGYGALVSYSRRCLQAKRARRTPS